MNFNISPGWEVISLLRHKRASHHEPPWEWDVHAENEDGFISSGTGNTIEEAVQDCNKSIAEGYMVRPRFDPTPTIDGAALLRSIGLASTTPIRRRKV